MHRISYRPAVRAALVLGLALYASAASAQTTFTACRVPDVGAIYMVGVSGAPDDCLDPSHVKFSWTEGGASVADGSITEAKLADGAVTSPKIAANAVGSSEIVDGAVTSAELSAGMIRWAGVSGAGSVYKSSGDVSATRTATGTYDLTWTQSLGPQSSCAFLATAVDSAHIPQTAHGDRFGGGENVLRVFLYDVNGALVNGGFEVAVICT